jgi:hypothetical protein
MAAPPRPPVVDGADLSLRAFLVMPCVAAALSVAMWLEMPTFSDALHARAPLLLARRDAFGRLAKAVPAVPVARSGCTAPLSPVPHFDRENVAATNMAVLSPDDLTVMNLTRTLKGDQDLYFLGQVTWLVRWVTDPPFGGRRMSRARIAAEIERPIADNRYVLFYGTRTVEPPPGAPADTLRVDAFVFDVTSGAQVCQIGFVTGGDQARERLLEAIQAAATATAR